MVDLRRLLDKYHVSYRDSGKNVSANNIVISCPFCNKTVNPDPSEHLAIHLPTGTFFCYRNSRHKGNAPRLLRYLGIPSHEYEDLRFKEEPKDVVKETKDFSLIRHFRSADQSEECIKYLISRGFSSPLAVIAKHKLCFDLAGLWAGRLIVPLTIGWTGRSMRNHIEPRYLTHSTEDGFFLYRQGATSCLLMEGPLDAMRVVSVSNQFDVIAETTNRIKPAIFSYLRESHYLSIYRTPDDDVPFDLRFEEMQKLRSYCTSSRVKELRLPEESKDYCAMTEHEAREFLVRHTN